MPRDHYRIKKQVRYIEREVGKIAAEVGEAIKSENIKQRIAENLAVIAVYADLCYQLIERDRRERINENVE